MSTHHLDLVTTDDLASELADTFEHSSSAMWIFDVHTMAFLAVNDAAVRQYGYSRSRFLSMTILDIRPSGDIVPLLREEIRNGKHNSDKLWSHRKKDGTVIEVEISSREVIFHGLQAEIVLVQAPERKPRFILLHRHLVG